MFREFGNVTGVVVVKGRLNTNQAYISFSTYPAAERAVNELNGKPPLLLKIQLQDKSEGRSKMHMDVDLSGPIYDHRYKDSPM